MPIRLRPTPRRRAANAIGASKSCSTGKALSHASIAIPALPLGAELCRHRHSGAAGLAVRTPDPFLRKLGAAAGRRDRSAADLGDVEPVARSPSPASRAEAGIL